MSGARKEISVHGGERAMKVFGAVALICAAAVLLGWGITRGAAQQEDVGRFQVAAPNLVLDTATGRLTTSKGEVLEHPLDPTGEEIGRYSVDGYVTAVTREVGLNVIQQPVVWPQLVKGYVVLDTQTGQIVREKIYYKQPLQGSDL
jgi:hypothetical protein